MTSEEEDRLFIKTVMGDELMVETVQLTEEVEPKVLQAFCAFARKSLRDGDKMALEFMSLLKNNNKLLSYKKAHPESFTHGERNAMMSFGMFLMLEKSRKEKEKQKLQRKKQKQIEEKTTIDTCDLCHDTKVAVIREELPEAFYRKFPEEQDVNSPGNCFKGQKHYHICLKCVEKRKEHMADLEQENPYLFKEFKEGRLSRDQLMEGLGDQVFRRP